MSEMADRMTLDALADRLADAASIHEAGARIADTGELKAILEARADRLNQLAIQLQNPVDDDRPGTVLRLLDHLRLKVDSWFGDDDEAASIASRDAKISLITFIDDHLGAPDLSTDTIDLLREVRRQIAGEKKMPTLSSDGLKGLPS